MYSTARLWDDGIIKPEDTRDVVSLGLGLAWQEYEQYKVISTQGEKNKGFGVFRM